MARVRLPTVRKPILNMTVESSKGQGLANSKRTLDPFVRFCTRLTVVADRMRLRRLAPLLLCHGPLLCQVFLVRCASISS
jgi:hypothetical protein